jgi:hypothetical protein
MIPMWKTEEKDIKSRKIGKKWLKIGFTHPLIPPDRP